MRLSAITSAVQGNNVSGRKAGGRSDFGADAAGGLAKGRVAGGQLSGTVGDGPMDHEMTGLLIAEGQEEGDVLVAGIGVDRHGRRLGQRQRLSQALAMVSGFGQRANRSTLRVA